MICEYQIDGECPCTCVCKDFPLCIDGVHYASDDFEIVDKLAETF